MRTWGRKSDSSQVNAGVCYRQCFAQKAGHKRPLQQLGIVVDADSDPRSGDCKDSLEGRGFSEVWLPPCEATHHGVLGPPRLPSPPRCGLHG